MVELIEVGIAGLGSYAPETVVTNDDLSKRVDTSDEWIYQRTGIRERRVIAEGECSGSMASIASMRAITDAGLTPQDIDLILCATTTPDNPLPSTACHVQADLKAWQAAGYDLNSACSGFVFGFTTAVQFIRTGMYRNVLVIGVESLSTILNWDDRNTCVIFGDGAGAMVLRPLEDCAGRGQVLSMSMFCEGGKDDVLQVPAGGSRMPASLDTVEKKLHYMVMGGNKVYRFAVNTFSKLVKEAVEPYGWDQLGLVIPHQVNQRIFEAACERLDLSIDHVYSNIHKYGNTAAASVPMAYDEAYRAGVLPKGKLIVSAAFGAGQSWGHFLVRW
ncbi:MAG: 3-oxoacyl-ACP synthase [Planctomycetota bacterium]|nr:MAG: 3-oxoacyl-ACP synthase [Planctomycetota bacterium]